MREAIEMEEMGCLHAGSLGVKQAFAIDKTPHVHTRPGY